MSFLLVQEQSMPRVHGNGPQWLGWSSLDHFAWGSPFKFTDAAFSGLLPRGVGFSHSWVAVSLLEFFSELPLDLFFVVIVDHGWGYTIALKDEGQGLMHLPFALHWVSTCPIKRRGMGLGCFVALSWHRPSKQCVAKHGVQHTFVPCTRPLGQPQVHTRC